MEWPGGRWREAEDRERKRVRERRERKRREAMRAMRIRDLGLEEQHGGGFINLVGFLWKLKVIE